MDYNSQRDSEQRAAQFLITLLSDGIRRECFRIGDPMRDYWNGVCRSQTSRHRFESSARASGSRQELDSGIFHYLEMSKEPVSIEIVQEGDQRFLLKSFANGEKIREPIVKLPRKKRYPDRPYWNWDFNKGKKKGF
jgi:hypothetical protein